MRGSGVRAAVDGRGGVPPAMSSGRNAEWDTRRWKAVFPSPAHIRRAVLLPVGAREHLTSELSDKRLDMERDTEHHLCASSVGVDCPGTCLQQYDDHKALLTSFRETAPIRKDDLSYHDTVMHDPNAFDAQQYWQTGNDSAMEEVRH